MLRNGVPGMMENECVRMPANAAAYAATIGALKKEPWMPYKEFGIYAKGQWFSKCDPPTSSINITWELKKCKFSRPSPDLLNKKLKGWDTVICVLTSPPGDSDAPWVWEPLPLRMIWSDLDVPAAIWKMDQRGRNWRQGGLKRMVKVLVH